MPRSQSYIIPSTVLILSILAAFLLSITTKIHAAGPICSVAIAGGTYTTLDAALADTGCSTIQVGTGTFATNVRISRSVKIEGVSVSATRLDGGGMDRFTRVMLVEPNVHVELRQLAIINGNAGNPAGGGIYNSGILTTTNILIQGNVGGGSGAVFNNGTMSIIDSTIAQNQGRSSGAILNDGTLTVRRSTITNNRGTTSGVINTNKITIENSTLSNNISDVGSVVNNFSGSTSISFTTLVNNSGGYNGTPVQSSALFNPGEGTLSIKATIVAKNGPGPNCVSGITSLGYNISDDATCNLTGTGDQANTDPLIGPLAQNGGPTQTHILLAQSPAIDVVPAGVCVSTDQRGTNRPVGGTCDAGAIELLVFDNFLFLPSIEG